jgi:GNAT superfamily N-acetyltransferase
LGEDAGVVEVRDARADDGPILTELVRTSAAYDGEYRVVVAALTVDAEYVSTHLTRVAEESGTTVGFHSLVVPGRRADREGELDYCFVADGHHGRGIGRVLAADLRRRAADLGLTRVLVVSHPPAEAFYRAVGARRVGMVAPAGRVTWSRPLLVLDV